VWMDVFLWGQALQPPFWTFYICPHDMTHNNQILLDDQTMREENFWREYF